MGETLAWAAGAVLGAMFFGGLWWTVRKGLSSERPALWFVASLVLRMILTVAGFVVVSGGNAKRLLLCLLGFATASLAMTRLTRPARENPGPARQEDRRAPHSG